MTALWISHPKFTGQVNIDDEDTELTILDTPPVWRAFKGQHLGRLLDWLRSLGEGLIVEVL